MGIWRLVNRQARRANTSPGAALRPLSRGWLGFAYSAIGLGVFGATALTVFYYGRLVDNIDLPFKDDPAAIGRWTSVDFVDSPAQFTPGSRHIAGHLYLKELVLLPEGRSARPWISWTRGVVMDKAQKTASRYQIRELGGTSYLFLEWKSGDYSFLRLKPAYYVLRQSGSAAGQGTEPTGTSENNNSQDNMRTQLVTHPLSLSTTLALGLLTNPVAPARADAQTGEKDFTVLMPIKVVKEYDDVRFKDMSKLDLSTRPGLAATLWFNQKTVWPAPLAVDPKELIASGMNPGLGVRKLHAEGWTGKGVNVAIIDQAVYLDHPEFAGKVAAYNDLGCESKSSMHGPAVLSLLVGTKCGTAPDARVYDVGARHGGADAAYYAKGLDWIVEQNASLPATNKIRVVSVSAGPSGPGSPFKKNNDLWDPACKRAEDAGIMVLDCTRHHGFLGPCYYEAAAPEDVTRCKPGFPSSPGAMPEKDRLLVPTSPRTTAEEYIEGRCGYQYCGQGGLSWGIPYCAGVLAMGWQARSDLTPAQMRELLFKSAYKTADGALIINPPEFIRMVKAAP
jgi:serine protease AprX